MARYKVTSPEGKEYILNGPEGASKEQLIDVLKYKLGVDQEEYRPDRGLLEAGGAGLRRGVERFKSTIGDVLPAMVASGLGFEDYAKKQLAENAETERNIAKYNPPEFKSYKQVDSPLSALKYGIEATSEVAPDIAASLIPGGIGGTIGRRVGMSALREAGVLGAEALAKEEAKRGALGTSVGVYLGSYAQNAPEVFNSIYRETGQMEPGVAALFGSVSAGLDSVLPASILKSMSAPVRVGVVEKILERSGMDAGLLRKVVSAMPEAAVKEGLTEAAQEAINISAEDFVKKTENIWGSKEWDRIVESGVRGTIGGGVFGAPVGVGQYVGERREEQAARDEQIRQEQQQIDNLLPEEPTSLEEAQRQIEMLRGLPESETVANKIAELEAYEPPPPPPPEPPASLLTKDVLNETGLKPQSGYYKQMAGKDMMVPEEAAQVDEVLDRMRKNKKLDPAILAGVEDLVNTARTPVEEAAQEEVVQEEVAQEEVPEVVAPPVAEVKEETGLGNLGSMAKAMTDNFYESAFDALEKGKTTISGVKDPILAKAKGAYDAGLITSPDDIRKFEENGYPQIETKKEEPPTPALFSADRKKTKERIPELEEMARGVEEGTLTKDQYDEGVKALKPVTPYKEIPAPATTADLERSLSKDKQDRIGAPRTELKNGYPVGLRLDIPAYTNHGVWAISVHEQQKNFNAGKSIGYDSVAAVTNPTFGAVEKAALSIATGKAKSTIAVVKGDWKSISEKQAVDQANKALKDKSWAQVGMDPTRHSYFYDRKTGEPIVSGDEAIMVGPLVLVKNPVYAPKEQFLFSTSPLVNAPQGEKGMTKAAVDRAVDNIKRTWTNAPDYETVQSVADLPKHLREQAQKDGVNPRGVYDPDDKKVYLVADNLPNAAQAAIVLAHEALGHFGLRVTLGAEFKPVLRSIYNSNKDVKDRADAYIKDGLVKEDAIEEVLSEMAQEVYDTTVPENKNKISALQKVVNYIRQFLRKIGVVKHFSNQDILGLIRQARHAVVTGPVKAPVTAKEGAKYSTNARNNLNIISGSINGLPKMSDDIKEGFLNAASNIPDGVRKAALGFLTMPQIEQLYGDALPSLKRLTKALEARAVDMQTRRQDISKNVTNWFSIAQKHKSVLPKFFDIANQTTLDQIDVLDPAFAGHPLTKKFQSLPPELQKVYKELRAAYKKSSDEYMSLLLQNLKQSPASVQRLKMEAKRMKVYLPLFRQGDYWVSYTNKAGERVSQSFDSQREANIAAEAVTKTGIKDVKKFTRLQQISYRSVPPTGFMGTVVKDLEKANVNKDVIDQIYQSYLSLFPAQSIRQQFRKREGRLGFTEDVLQVYANMATRMANQLANMKYAPDVEDSVTGVRKEFENDPSMEHRDVVDNMQKQLDFIRNPVNGSLVAKASYFSYMWFIAGNVSSALVNLTQMPIVVYPLLGGKYGFGKAADAMQKATSMYMKGGKDNNSEFLPDFTFGANAKGEYKQLYDAAVQSAAIRRSTGYELTEARKSNVEDFTGRRAKIEHGLGWIFQNSERANREITLIAAFDLARKAGKSVDVAIDEALSLVNDAHGTSLSETGPRFFQQGIGKVAFTFKRFAQAQIYLLGRLFHQAFKGYDKKTRDIARNQLLGIAGMSYIFAGIQGMPMYGAVSLLANMLMDDDDEPFDMDATIRKSMGDIGYKGPVNALLAVDIASRTGFNGLLWKDDPKRLAEIGPSLYMIEQAAGPAYGAFRNAERGLKLINEGEIERGMEALMPSFVRNGLKAFRLGTEGALTKDGIKITDDVGAYNVFMQIFGFNPAALAEAQADAGAMKRAEQGIRDRRSALLDKLDGARMNGDSDGVSETMKAIQRFNTKNPEIPINAKTIASSFNSRRRREAESVNGVFLDRKLRTRLMEEYGGDD